LQLTAHGQSGPEPLAAGARGHAGQPRRPEAHWPGSKERARASTVPRDSGGDCRRRAAPLDAGQDANDAGLERDPKNGCATTSWSPETTLTTMAHGGTRHRTTAGKKTRPSRRYGEREREGTGRDDAEAHHGDARMLGDGRGGRRRRESTMNSSRCSYGKPVMATQRRRSAKRSSAWT